MINANEILLNSVQFLWGEKRVFLLTYFLQRHTGNASSVQFTFAPTWVRKWVSALMFTLYQIWFWFLEPDFENQRFQCNFESLQLPWPEGPPTGGATGTTSTGGRKYKSRRSLFVSILCNLIGPRCLCQISLASCAVVLDAGPLLEPPVPPLVRLPVVRDAGPLLEPLVPPLVRLRAGGPAGQCRTGGAHRTLWFLLSKKTWLLSTKKVVQVQMQWFSKLFKLHFALICPLRIFGRGTGPREDWQNFDETREFSRSRQQNIFRRAAFFSEQHILSVYSTSV